MRRMWMLLILLLAGAPSAGSQTTPYATTTNVELGLVRAHIDTIKAGPVDTLRTKYGWNVNMSRIDWALGKIYDFHLDSLRPGKWARFNNGARIDAATAGNIFFKNSLWRFTPTTTATELIDVEDQGIAAFYGTAPGNGQYIGLQAPSLVLSTVTFKLPDADGLVGGTLITAGAAGGHALSFGVPGTRGRAIPAQFGDGSDGAVTISGNTTLTRDQFYSVLKVNTGIVLTTDGFRVFVRDTLYLNGTAKIVNSGLAGGNGTAASGITPGTGATSRSGATANYLAGGTSSGAGGDGGVDGSPNGSGGSAGGAISNAVLASGTIGRAGGDGGISSTGFAGSTGQAGTGGGTATALAASSGGIRNIENATLGRAFSFSGLVTWTCAGGQGSGGGGGRGGLAGGVAGTGGGGGGGASSGGNGGVIVLCARVISGAGTIEAKGGAGGVGGAGGMGGTNAGNFGGGGGGAGGGNGGNGGIIVIASSDTTAFSGSISAAGGALGAGGAGGASGGGTAAAGNAGVTGLAGTAGIIMRFFYF